MHRSNRYTDKEVRNEVREFDMELAPKPVATKQAPVAACFHISVFGPKPHPVSTAPVRARIVARSARRGFQSSTTFARYAG